MQSATRIAVSAFLITSALASAYQNSAKLRRDGVLSLYPFPRVGRAQRQTWQLPLEEAQLEYKPEQKRQMYAFPRVGRSDALASQQPLATNNQEMTTDNREYRKRQMYAFPRVGRSGLPLTLDQLRVEPLQQPQILLPQLFRHPPLPPQPAIAEPLNQYQEVMPALTSLDSHRLHKLMELMKSVRRNSLSKRESATDKTGMWFGPRLGRAAKDGDDEDIAIDNQTNEVSEPESSQALDEDRKKRQV